MTKALFFDIDGTLVSFETHRIPSSTIEALEAAHAKGLKIFIATGRPKAIINNLSELQDRNLIDGYITMNGAYCFVGEEVIYKSAIPQEEVKAMAAFCEKKGVPCIFVEEHNISVCQPNEMVKKIFYDFLHVNVNPTDSFEEESKKEVIQMTPFITEEEEKEVNLEDTLTETKTFEQMREEGSAELDKALKSAKESVGKQDQYNTRMDILSKIREPEKNTIKIDSVESYATQEFAKGMFVNNKVEEEPKEKMTFMEKLAAMSPEEDVKKAEEFLQQESEEMEEKQAEEITETKEIVETVEENPVEDIEENDTFIEDEEEIIENKGESKVVKVMNVIIVILVIIFIALLGVILYQSFF